MGEIREIKEVKLICGLLAVGVERLEQGQAALEERFGPADLVGEIFPFDFTSYYAKELGEGILRQYISFVRLIDPGELAEIKLETNRMEEELAKAEKRAVNLDPGYLDLSKMVLASTKDATYRVYLGQGIYAQSTYYFQNGSYHPWQWTYADYQTAIAIGFFNRVREKHKQQLR